VDKARVVTTDAEIDAALEQVAKLDSGTMVVQAAYNKPLDLIVLHLQNGRRAVFPREDLQWLRDAPASKLAKVEVLGGVGLRWEELDVDLYVPALLKGILGSQRWMAELGRKGGEAKSAKKAEAARKNGARGGRPRRAAALTA
jgi:hypothetical protein